MASSNINITNEVTLGLRRSPAFCKETEELRKFETITVVLENGAIISGGRRKGELHGRVTLYHPATGAKYEGRFRKGLPHGRGKVTEITGEFFSVRYKKGRCVKKEMVGSP